MKLNVEIYSSYNTYIDVLQLRVHNFTLPVQTIMQHLYHRYQNSIHTSINMQCPIPQEYLGRYACCVDSTDWDLALQSHPKDLRWGDGGSNFQLNVVTTDPPTIDSFINVRPGHRMQIYRIRENCQDQYRDNITIGLPISSLHSMCIQSPI